MNDDGNCTNTDAVIIKHGLEREDASGIRLCLRYIPTFGIFHLAGTAIGVKLVR